MVFGVTSFKVKVFMFIGLRVVWELRSVVGLVLMLTVKFFTLIQNCFVS